MLLVENYVVRGFFLSVRCSLHLYANFSFTQYFYGQEVCVGVCLSVGGGNNY